MIKIFKVISTRFDGLQRRLVKTLRGKSDAQEILQASPFGVDSNPVKDMVAIYAPSAKDGKSYVIGYIQKNQLADVGELRNYSTDDEGNVKFYIHLKNDGTALFNGDDDHLVRHSEMKKGFDELKQDLNQHISEAFNLHTHLETGGTTSVPSVMGLPSTASVDDAKIDEMKTFKK